MARTFTPAADVVFIGFVVGQGGDALQMLALARGTSSLGARVRIVVPGTPSTRSFAEQCAEAGVECERSPLITATPTGARQNIFKVWKLLRSLEARIVHFHTGNSLLPRSVMLCLELLRFRPCFVTIHGPYETVRPGSVRAWAWARSVGRRFTAVVSPSEHGSSFQRRCGVSPPIAVTINNSVDLEVMRHGDASNVRSQLGVDANTPIVLFSSRIDDQKRPVDAVRIFAAVAGDHPSALLVFVGNGDRVDAVAAEAERLGLGDRVRLVGYQTNIPDWLAAATVWLLPTEKENFSVAVLEALAAGCVVLSTSCRGNDEVLIDGDNALTFAVGDVAAASASLTKLLGDETLRHRLAAGARRTSEQYGVGRMVDRYLSLYNTHPDVPAALSLSAAARQDAMRRNCSSITPAS